MVIASANHYSSLRIDYSYSVDINSTIYYYCWFSFFLIFIFILLFLYALYCSAGMTYSFVRSFIHQRKYVILERILFGILIILW
jgi:hypothetical protein